MAEEKKEPWLNYLALSTVILAVCATLATFKGSGYSTRAMLSQSQASDQWAFYQAKGIKGYIYEMQREKLELETEAMRGKVSSKVIEDYEKKMEAYSKKIKKYDDEKTEIQTEAKKLEGIRDDAKRHSQAFGVAVIYLQIAILLSSIAALMKKKAVWMFGLGVGIIGIVHFANGFLLFIG